MYTEQPEHTVEECTRLTTQLHCQNHIHPALMYLTVEMKRVYKGHSLAFHSNPL